MARSMANDTPREHPSSPLPVVAFDEAPRSARLNLSVQAAAQRLHCEIIADPHCVFAMWLGQFRDAASGAAAPSPTH